MNYKNWIFDLDGTITIAKHDFTEIKRVLGIPLDQDIIDYINAQPETIRDRLNAKLNEIEEDIVQRTEPQKHFHKVINRLKSNQCNLAVITRNTKLNAINTLKQIKLNTFFPDHLIIGRNEFKAKPAPDAINHLINLWNANLKETCIVGDYLYDLQSGFNAKIDTIHYNQINGQRWPEFTTHHINSFSEILEYI